MSFTKDQMHWREAKMQALHDHESRVYLYYATKRQIETVSLDDHICILSLIT